MKIIEFSRKRFGRDTQLDTQEIIPEPDPLSPLIQTKNHPLYNFPGFLQFASYWNSYIESPNRWDLREWVREKEDSQSSNEQVMMEENIYSIIDPTFAELPAELSKEQRKWHRRQHRREREKILRFAKKGETPPEDTLETRKAFLKRQDEEFVLALEEYSVISYTLEFLIGDEENRDRLFAEKVKRLTAEEKIRRLMLEGYNFTFQYGFFQIQNPDRKDKWAADWDVIKQETARQLELLK